MMMVHVHDNPNIHQIFLTQEGNAIPAEIIYVYLQPEGHFGVEVVLFLSHPICTHCPNHLNLIIVIHHLDLVSGGGGRVCV